MIAAPVAVDSVAQDGFAGAAGSWRVVPGLPGAIGWQARRAPSPGVLIEAAEPGLNESLLGAAFVARTDPSPWGTPAG